MKYLRTISGLAGGATLLVMSASANEFNENALAVTNAAMAGRWLGTEYFTEASEEHEVQVTIATTGEKGLSQSLWSQEFMINIDYAGSGAYSQQLIGEVTIVGETLQGQWTDISMPDADGNWSRTTLIENPPGPGSFRHHYVMQDGILNIIAERQEKDGNSEFQPYWTLTLMRAN